MTYTRTLIIYLIFITIIINSCLNRSNETINLFKDCGSEEIRLGKSLNTTIRDCIIKSFQECLPAKINQTIYTIEGDPIITTLIINGFKYEKCEVHVYFDSKDTFGFYGKKEYICYNMTYDTRFGVSKRKVIRISNCESGVDFEI